MYLVLNLNRQTLTWLSIMYTWINTNKQNQQNNYITLKEPSSPQTYKIIRQFILTIIFKMIFLNIRVLDHSF